MFSNIFLKMQEYYVIFTKKEYLLINYKKIDFSTFCWG